MISEKARILVVDDEPKVREILLDLLGHDHECVAAASAEEALELLPRDPAQIIISDINMDGMSGLEMIPHAQELCPDTVVVMISGIQTIESAIEALRLGAFDYITKPFDLRQVEAVVNRALEHYKLVQEKRHYERYLEELVRERTQELDRAMVALDDAYRATLKALGAALETRDTETHGHSERVVSFSLRLGHELDLAPEVMRSLEFGALLHDIGKIGVPDSILLKPGKLTDAEWVRMREHPNYGYQILRGIPFLRGAAQVVAQHHEKWDGSGYPLGLRGEEIDINARIFSVADAFDAMVSDRVYRPGRPYEAAAAELNDFSGTQFDPEVVAAFNRVPAREWDELKRLSLLKRDELSSTTATEHVKKHFSLKTSLTYMPATSLPTVTEIVKMRTTIVDLAAVNGHDDRFHSYRTLAAQLEESLVRLAPRL